MYILYKVSLGHRNGYVALVYRLPSQTNNEFENFLENCENMLNQTWSTNTLFRAIPGDFNVMSSAWWTGDNTTSEGNQQESLTSFCGYQSWYHF